MYAKCMYVCMYVCILFKTECGSISGCGEEIAVLRQGWNPNRVHRAAPERRHRHPERVAAA